MIYFSHIPIFLGWLFCIAAGERYCLLQIQLQRNLFTANKNKNIFISPSVFSPTPAYFVQYFLTVTHCLCKCFCHLYFVETLEPSLMHFFEPEVVSMSIESGNGSKLDVLLGYNLPRVAIHHNAYISAVREQQTRIIIFMHWDYSKNYSIRLWSPDK